MADSDDPMKTIFHEKQEGSLCAQHCLNALLQGNYFSPVDLAEIGRVLDEDERIRMAEAGTHSEEYQKFLQQPSSNYDDSGFFSIQVIQQAVLVWNVELIPFTSSDAIAIQARENPRSQQGYICNFREHWFTIRKLGQQWFNLNSLLTDPELVSDTYLSLLLTQLQQEGYSIFVVSGSLPHSDADQILNIIKAVQPIKPRLISDSKPKTGGATGSSTFEDDDIRRALEESKRFMEEDDQSLKRALAMSMEGLPPDFTFPVEQPLPGIGEQPHNTTLSDTYAQAAAVLPPSQEELREKRLVFLNEKATGPSQSEGSSQAGSSSNPDMSVNTNKPVSKVKPTVIPPDISEKTEDEMLQLALKMSMEGKEKTE